MDENEMTKSKRPDKYTYYLNIAKGVAMRSTCLRRKFGAIIVKNDRIVSTGYSGAPVGRKNCCDIGVCQREKLNIKPGERYELCRSVHAEMNAIINATKEEMEGATLYLVGVENDGSLTENTQPCALCKRVIINSGIDDVMTPEHLFDVSIWVNNDETLSDAPHEGY